MEETGRLMYAQTSLQTVLQHYEMLQNNTETSTRKAWRSNRIDRAEWDTKVHSQSWIFIIMTGV